MGAPKVTAETTASFERSLIPMLVADDRRRYVDANRAACLLLRLPRREVLRLSIDDLTPPELREGTAELWEAFIREGTQSGTFELQAPDGGRVAVEYSAAANVAPGRHLSLLYALAGEEDWESLEPSEREIGVLSQREREVLRMVAMGERGAAIGLALGVSPATVETHVRNCLEKLGAKNRAHAIALGLQRGEIAIRLDGDPQF